MATTTTTNKSAQKIGIPRPAAPGAISDPLRQDVSFYKSLRSVVDVLNQQTAPTTVGDGLVDIGKVTATLPDGTPETLSAQSLNATLLRVYGAGNPAAPPGAPMWVPNGPETQVAHGLGRVPVGYWVVRNNIGAMITDGDSAWDTTYIYFHTTHSDSDIIMFIF